MSKQIAILLDNSGSMFNPVGGANPNDKIYETARGAEFFLENLIDELAVTPDAEFAISIHRFASSYEVLPGGAQIDTSQANFSNALSNMQSAIAAIENQAASSAAVGVMTDLYDGVRQVADYLTSAANQLGSETPIRRLSSCLQTACRPSVTVVWIWPIMKLMKVFRFQIF